MDQGFQVRRARRGDLAAIGRIETASFGPDAYDRNLFAEYLRNCGELFLVAERGRRICGYMIACLGGGSRPAEVVSLAVEPAGRQKGAASALMRSTLRRLRLRRVARLALMVKATNHPARRFYEKFGFRPVRRVRKYYEDGRDGIVMRLEL